MRGIGVDRSIRFISANAEVFPKAWDLSSNDTTRDENDRGIRHISIKERQSVGSPSNDSTVDRRETRDPSGLKRRHIEALNGLTGD